jgi:PBP1b-binding outer membrane lipoprotein LpoB
MKQLKLVFAVCLMFIGFNSCQKEETTATVDEISLSQQETQAEETLADVDLLVDEAVDSNFSSLKSASIESAVYLTDCPVITVNKTATPQVITIDFGTACTGKDGKVRSGKIIVTSTSFTTFPSVRDKSFDNYYVDSKKIEGSIAKTITKDQENNIRTAVIKENITITFPDGEGKATRVADLTRQYQRNTLLNPLDNQIVSWGTVEFTRISGVKVTKTITSADPLVFKVACHHIVSGTVSVTTSNNRSWTINYGDGTCDAKATLTMDGKTKEIKIR